MVPIDTKNLLLALNSLNSMEYSTLPLDPPVVRDSRNRIELGWRSMMTLHQCKMDNGHRWLEKDLRTNSVRNSRKKGRKYWLTDGRTTTFHVGSIERQMFEGKSDTT